MITYNSGGAYRFRTYKESSALGTTYAESTTTLSANTWYHVAFTIDNTALKIYVNGVLENTTASAFNFDYEVGKSIILGGTNESNYNTPFKGVIDNLRFYNRILTAQEISALYTQDPACKEVVTVGIKTNSFEEMSATIYPNPTTGKINIETTEGNLQEYEVFNLLGMQLFKGKLTDKENTITIEEYPKGVYFLKLKNERSENTIRIVKE